MANKVVHIYYTVDLPVHVDRKSDESCLFAVSSLFKSGAHYFQNSVKSRARQRTSTVVAGLQRVQVSCTPRRVRKNASDLENNRTVGVPCNDTTIRLSATTAL